MFVSLFGPNFASKLPQDSPVDLSTHVLTPFVGRPYGEIKNAPAIARVGRILELTDHLTFPDLLAPLQGLTGGEIRRLVHRELNFAPSRKARIKANGIGSIIVVALMAIALGIAMGSRLFAKECPVCVACQPCQTCPICPTCPTCQSCPVCPTRPQPPICDFDFDSSGKKKRKGDPEDPLELCVKILIARERGRPQDFLGMNVTKASKRDLKKKVRQISLLVHPDKVSKGLWAICAEALAYVNEFGR